MQYCEVMSKIRHFFALHRIAAYEAFADKGVHNGQMPLLKMIGSHQASTQKELADLLHVSPASIAVSLKRLQKQGLITKAADSGDLRYNRIALTDEGKQTVSRTRETFDDLDKRVFKDFTEEELIQLDSYVCRMIKNLSGNPNFDMNDFHAVMAEEHKIIEEERRLNK